MGKKEVIIDTNILISAFGWGGKPRDVLRKVLEEGFEVILSQKQEAEIRRVLSYPKFCFTDDQKERFLGFLRGVATIVETHEHVDILTEDPDDNMLLEAALTYNADYIVTGDAQVLKLRRFRETKICTATEFIEEKK